MTIFIAWRHIYTNSCFFFQCMIYKWLGLRLAKVWLSEGKSHFLHKWGKNDSIRILVFWDMILHHWVKVQNVSIMIPENEGMKWHSNVGVQLPLMRSHIPEVCNCELCCCDHLKTHITCLIHTLLECRVDQTLKFLKVNNYFNLTYEFPSVCMKTLCF